MTAKRALVRAPRTHVCDSLVRGIRAGGHKVEGILEEMWLPRREDLRGSQERSRGSRMEPNHALLRTAAPHGEKASAPRLGHSHHPLTGETHSRLAVGGTESVFLQIG